MGLPLQEARQSDPPIFRAIRIVFVSSLDNYLMIVKAVLPLILKLQLLLIPFVLLEQFLPAGNRPRPRDYLLNTLILVTTFVMSLPLGMLAGAGGAAARQHLGLHPLNLSFQGVGAVPYIGTGLKLIVVMAATLVLHDLWFYWSHRLEHRLPILWEFHKLHHSEQRLNSSTWARDHFLQAAWRSAFPAFTFGLVLRLDVAEAASLGVYASYITSALSMFYHSGVRLHLPWLNPVLVTPQVHRIHHSVDPGHQNKNFADFLLVFDIIFWHVLQTSQG